MSSILTISCSKTLADQQNLVNEEDSQTVLQKAKDYSASIIGVSDSRSILSDCTNTNTLGLEFDFDASLLGSQAYRSAHRSNLRQLTSTAMAPEPRYSSLYDFQHNPLSHLQDQLEEPSSVLEFHDTDLPLLDDGDDPSYRNESSNSKLDPNAKKFKQLPKMYSDWIADPPCQPAGTAQKSVTAPDLAAKAQGAARSSSQSPRKRDTALTVLSPSLASADAVALPKLPFLRSLREYWHTRTMNQAANRSKAWSSLAARRIAVSYPNGTQARQQQVKLLILGSSESGKTTLFKDIELCAGGGYTREDRDCFAEIIRRNIVDGIRIILKAMESLEIPLQNKENEHHAQYILMWAAQAGDGCSAEAATAAITELWADTGVQEAFRRRHEYQSMDSVSYFASHIQRVTPFGYSPIEEDILRSRIKTIGITETEIHLEDTTFRVFDVGGMRSQRKKWIHAFEDVDSIVFTVDTSAYCRKLFEDERVNRMLEQLVLWDSVANNRWFMKTNFVLMFTKVDSLPETIELCPITKYFPDFQEPVESCGMAQLIDSYLAFLKSRFLSLMQSEEARQRTQVVFADLVHINYQNPADLVLKNLKARLVAQK